MDKNFSYTTGTYAAAAAKAALMTLLNENDLQNVEINLPSDEKALIPLKFTRKKKDYAECGVIKKSVEKEDVTDNMEIVARVSLRKDNQVVIDGGNGVGRITKQGLQLPIGEAAINPVPRNMILSAVKELTDNGVNVIISVPDGERIAAKTTNARLGIIGGISIIGTTGIMKRKSHSSFKQTILDQLKFCKENDFNEVIITPGNISEQAMQMHFRDKFQDHQIVQSGDYLGFALKNAYKNKFSILLAGHPGKLGKVLSGHFQTHYTKAPSANQAVIDFFKNKVDDDILKELEDSPTVEGMITTLQNDNKEELFSELAEQIAIIVQEYLKSDSPIPTLFFNMNKDLIGKSKAGKLWIDRK